VGTDYGPIFYQIPRSDHQTAQLDRPGSPLRLSLPSPFASGSDTVLFVGPSRSIPLSFTVGGRLFIPLAPSTGPPPLPPRWIISLKGPSPPLVAANKYSTLEKYLYSGLRPIYLEVTTFLYKGRVFRHFLFPSFPPRKKPSVLLDPHKRESYAFAKMFLSYFQGFSFLLSVPPNYGHHPPTPDLFSPTKKHVIEILIRSFSALSKFPRTSCQRKDVLRSD